MADHMLIRTYAVGFGDCILVRIPDKKRDQHILIDCGTSAAAEPTLKDVMDEVKSLLPYEKPGGKKVLDLLCVTHPHADHIKGFDPEWFGGVKIRRVWLSAFMKEDHPQTKKSLALSAYVHQEVNSLLKRGLSLSPGLRERLRNGIWNPGAMEALRTQLPKASGITTLYVSRDVAKVLSASERKKHKVKYSRQTTTCEDFGSTGARLRVLAPEWDIDGYYLGRDSETPGYGVAAGPSVAKPTGRGAKEGGLTAPTNISAGEFRRLRGSLLHSVLTFTHSDERLKNNTSVVLLLEWKGRRLLFAGDAEWDGKGLREGKRSSAWDVMLEKDKKVRHLAKRIDFLKVGHHGSVNGTPFVDQEGAKQEVLDKLLPTSNKGLIVVSTEAGKHGEEKEVPYPELMVELGRRAANAKKYSEDPHHPTKRQPERTDYAPLAPGQKVRFVDVTLSPSK
jgi:beta-lactamase superfamily II metal-dependent hydrolase